MKRIGIDCRLAGIKHAGIGRYIEELVKRVINDRTIQWVLFFYEPNQIDLPQQDNIKIVIAPIRHYTISEQLFMPRFFYLEQLDLLHVPHYNVPLLYQGKLIVTIHDLLWHSQNNANATTLSPFVHAVKYQAYKFVTHHAVESAQKIIVPAKTVKKELLHYFSSIKEENVIPIYEGATEKFITTKIQDMSPKTLFYTGSLYPHKNLFLVVRALKDLPGYELYISSSRGVFVEQFLQQVKKLGLESRVHHLGRLSDEELVYWYQRSFAFIQPSLSEGFGLTGIEAMATGIPVIASDIPIFKEIYQDAYISFDPRSVASFVTAVQTLEKANRKEMVSKGQQLAKNYSWDKMAETTKDIYMDILSS